MLNDSDFMRYSRQLLIDEVGPQGQLRLQQAKVLIIGMGGLGCPAALYLAGAGVGTLYLADDDQLHITNLQRQILYRTSDIGTSKVALAKAQLMALNPQCQVISCHEHLSGQALQQRVAAVDMVLDCSDNMPTRHAINRACLQAGKTLISGSAIGFNGQLLVLTPPYEHGCYACLFPDEELAPLNCRTAGVLGPVVGMIGSAQALEAIKILTGQPSTLNGQLQLFDGKQQRWQRLALTRSPQCPVCGEKS